MHKRGNVMLAVALALMSGITSVSQQTNPPQPGPEHKKLGVFVGAWKDEGEIKPGPLGPGGKMSLTETCDWFTGGFSVVCHTETTGFMGDLKALTVLTYAPEGKVYRLYEFNSIGWSNTSTGILDGNTWTFDGESKIDGKVIKSRSAIRIPSPDFATMTSELSVDGGPWTLVMELKATRVKQNQTGVNSCAPHGSEGWPFELYGCLQNYLDKIRIQPGR